MSTYDITTSNTIWMDITSGYNRHCINLSNLKYMRLDKETGYIELKFFEDDNLKIINANNPEDVYNKIVEKLHW